FETGVNFFGICDDSDFKGSNLSNGTRGLTVGIYPNIGGSLIGPQEHKGNEWVGGFGDVGAYFVGDLIQSFSSRFLVDPGNPNYSPNTNLPGWFNTEDDQNNTYECTIIPEGLHDLSCTPFDRLIHEGNSRGTDEKLLAGIQILGFENDAQNWVLNRHLLNRIKNGKTTFNSSEMSLFQNTSSSTTFGQLNEVFNTATGFRNHPSYVGNSSSIENAQINVMLKLDELANEVVNLIDGTITQGTFETIRNIKLTENESLNTNIKNLVSDNEILKLNHFVTAQSLNNSITPLLLPAQNEKYIHSIFLEGINVDQIPNLESIAGQCPLEGGDGVYLARGILNYFGTSYDDSDDVLCLSSNNRQLEAEKPSVESITLHPNPADDIITLQGNLIGARNLVFYDWKGSLVHSVKLKQGPFSIKIETNVWSPGVYFYGLENGKIQKLIITR
ncbi:MAG: hypothetical protein HKN16_05890, partial [Saprospiraceae bacterium]|nr:hypothetical protein [Saprospiraceae bacterium]